MTLEKRITKEYARTSKRFPVWPCVDDRHKIRREQAEETFYFVILLLTPIAFAISMIGER